MKKEGMSNFWGCCVIAVAILVSGYFIANNLPHTTEVPADLYVKAFDDGVSYGDYLSTDEAAEYLGINYYDIIELFESGELDSVIYEIGDSRIISKQALQEWVEAKVAE